MMFTQLLIVSLLSVVAYGTTLNECPTGLKRDMYLKVFENNCYRFEIKEKKEFNVAQNQCKQYGGNLALVKSTDVNEFIKNTLQETYQFHGNYVWIGLRHSYDTQGLQWLDGSSVNFERFKLFDSYAPNECIAMSVTTGNWLGYRCQAKYSYFERKNNFVCEYPKSNTTTATTNTTSTTTVFIPSAVTVITPEAVTEKPQPLSVRDCPLSLTRDKYLIVYEAKCYKFDFDHAHNSSFGHAKTYCQREGGHLVTINSMKVNNFITRELRYTYYRRQYPVWIGFRYDAPDEMFKWSDGTSVTFTNFRRGEDMDRHECVALMPNDGKWKSFKCDDSETLKPFVCEYPVNHHLTSAPTVSTSTTPSATTPIPSIPSKPTRPSPLTTAPSSVNTSLTATATSTQ